jgi:hypothetical protein
MSKFSKMTIPQLKKLVAIHKKEHCPNVSKMNKQQLVDFVSDMEVISDDDNLEPEPEKKQKKEKKATKKTTKQEVEEAVGFEDKLNSKEEKQWKLLVAEIRDVKTFDDEKLNLNPKEMTLLKDLYNRVSDKRRGKLLKEIASYYKVGRQDEVAGIIKKLKIKVEKKPK